jgi:purine-nucleoside phosphorylase
MKFLGISLLMISNAAGGVNPSFNVGDLMIIRDHISFATPNPLVGKNEDELGPRFPDMSEPYNYELIELAENIALENKIKVQKGVYVAVPGPNLETRAEYKFLRATGADVVGMSTIPENIVANHMGMKVMGVSIVTDECFPDTLKAVNVEEIIATAMQAEPKMTLIMKELIKRLK